MYSAPRNVTTNPRCKVMDKSIPYMMDEYNRYSDFERVFKLLSFRKQEWKVRVRKKNNHLEVLFKVDILLIKIRIYLEILRCHRQVRENLLQLNKLNMNLLLYQQMD